MSQETYSPEGYNTINPFVITKEAPKLIEFLAKVFGAVEIPEAHTVDTDGLLLHSEPRLGDSVVMVADTKPGWPFTPSLLRVYVEDVERTLATAEGLGATVVTKPTDFFGEILSRFQDPWGNLWWVCQRGEQAQWEEGAGDTSWDESADEASWDSQSEELTYIHETLLDTMSRLAKK